MINIQLQENEVERLLQAIQFFGEESDTISDKIFAYKLLRALGFGNLKNEKSFSRDIFKDKYVTKEKYIVVLQSELDSSAFDYIGKILFVDDIQEAIKIGDEFVKDLLEYPALAGYDIYKLCSIEEEFKKGFRREYVD